MCPGNLKVTADHPPNTGHPLATTITPSPAAVCLQSVVICFTELDLITHNYRVSQADPFTQQRQLRRLCGLESMSPARATGKPPQKPSSRLGPPTKIGRLLINAIICVDVANEFYANCKRKLFQRQLSLSVEGRKWQRVLQS